MQRNSNVNRVDDSDGLGTLELEWMEILGRLTYYPLNCRFITRTVDWENEADTESSLFLLALTFSH